ncbi:MULTISPECIES: YigZ family protein [unclassified Meiothermus]|uniref:IMPACT family protein n=1 Tax=unclassified Meiothermus TaxID=370471 RepID=UPI000D7CB690|nr:MULTISPECIES: YigZ family protein [unclassified Meiothermus]PZA05691.1 IMPACT family protein [Meiothermus sp. Pnk-1]RYM29937.1 YigZ family protein [Meiothermus sp. PNK-Is4]
MRITLAEPCTFAQHIQRSRFIVKAAPVESPEEALGFLKAVAEPEATHNCWAYRIGLRYRFCDDGEPGGTAGQPILRAIDGQGLDGVMVVVTRYFGGVKLGAGGLVRAYGGVAAECLRQARKREVVPLVRLRLGVPFEMAGQVYGLLERWSLAPVLETYSEAGLEVEILVEEARLEEFRQAVVDGTRGRAAIRRLV